VIARTKESVLRWGDRDMQGKRPRRVEDGYRRRASAYPCPKIINPPSSSSTEVTDDAGIGSPRLAEAVVVQERLSSPAWLTFAGEHSSLLSGWSGTGPHRGLESSGAIARTVITPHNAWPPASAQRATAAAAGSRPR